MSVKEAVLAALKELVLPELQILRQEQGEMKAVLTVTNKRLDDLNAHLLDQSRRIDALREELTGRIDAVREELTGRIDAVREELSGRIEGVRESLTGRIEGGREELTGRIDAIREELTGRIDETNRALTRLYEVIVRREEYHDLASRVRALEQEVAELKKRLAA